MNSDQVMGQLRTVIASVAGATIGAWLVAKGYISQALAEQIVNAIAGALAAAAVAWWSAKSKSNSSLIASVVAAAQTDPGPLLAAIAPTSPTKGDEGVPGVKGIVTTPAVANATPSDKVVSKSANIRT